MRRMFVCLAAVCLSIVAFTSCTNYSFSVTCRDCDASNCFIWTGAFAVCENDRRFQYTSPRKSISPFLKAPLDEIRLEWSLLKGTDVERVPAVFGPSCIEAKKSFPEQNVYYCEKMVRIHVPDFLKGRKLGEILFDFYHDKVIVAYRVRYEDMPTSESNPIFVYYYLEDGTPYDDDASNFPEYVKKNPAAREEDYMKEQRRLYDAFREKFPGKSDSDFLIFLRYVQRTPFLPGGADSPIPRIEFDVKYRSYVIPDWMKPYENVPLEDIFGTE